MIHTIRIPYRRASSRLGSWLLWITGRLRTFLDFSLGSKFCFCCKAFLFVQGHAVGIIENVGRGEVASFLFRHSGLKIAPQPHIRLPPSRLRKNSASALFRDTRPDTLLCPSGKLGLQTLSRQTALSTHRNAFRPSLAFLKVGSI